MICNYKVNGIHHCLKCSKPSKKKNIEKFTDNKPQIEEKVKPQVKKNLEEEKETNMIIIFVLLFLLIMVMKKN